MFVKYLAAAMLASVLLPVPAFAESAQKPLNANAVVSPATMQQVGTWRTSKLIGLNVYSNEDKIGDINELISDSSGKVDLVVIGVGGFLGMGERNVVLAWNQLKFVMEPRAATAASKSTTRTSTTGAGTPAATSPMAPPAIAENADRPDHAVVNISKEQLAALPVFKYLSDTNTTQTLPPQAR
jgi:hypothetical protein